MNNILNQIVEKKRERLITLKKNANINSILDKPEKYESIRIEARNTIIKDYDLHTKCLPEQLKIIDGLLNE